MYADVFFFVCIYLLIINSLYFICNKTHKKTPQKFCVN